MKKTLLTLLAAFLISMPAYAAPKTPVKPIKQRGDMEINVTPKTRKSVSVTVYNNGLGLVRDVRSVNLQSGKNSLAFVDVSASIQPETALFLGRDVSVLEQNFNFDLLSQTSLLNKFLGKQIQVLRTNAGNGKETLETATVLAVDAGLVLKIGDRIETNYDGRLIFPDVPANLRDRPTLVIDVIAKAAGLQDVELAYLTNGMSWKADYVAELNDDETKIALNGWVTLTNTTGVSYENASLQLVAGDVNRVRPQRPVMMKAARNAVMLEAAAFDSAVSEQELMDYHLYSLGRATDILSNQTKQVALLNAPSVSASKVYNMENIVPVYAAQGMRNVDMRNAKVKLKFENKKADGLGMALPAGTVRVYKSDDKKSLYFVGEDSIRHTPENEKIELTLGDAFDVTASAKQTDFTQMGEKTYDATYEITFKNAKKTPVVISYYQSFPQTFRILTQSVKSENDNASRVKWEIPVKASGETVLTFSVRVSRP